MFVLVGAGGAGRAIAFGVKSRGARVVIFNRKYGTASYLFKNYGCLLIFIHLRLPFTYHILFFFSKERAKALAAAVSGEALPYEQLNDFCPEKGMILANASAVGMQPRTDQTPISKVVFLALQYF